MDCCWLTGCSCSALLSSPWIPCLQGLVPYPELIGQGSLKPPRTCPLPGPREEREREERPELYLQELLRPEPHWRWRSSWHRSAKVREPLDSPSVQRSVPTTSWSRPTTAAVQPRSIIPRRDCMVTGIFLLPYPVLRPSEIIILPEGYFWSPTTLPPFPGADCLLEKPEELNNLQFDYIQFYPSEQLTYFKNKLQTFYSPAYLVSALITTLVSSALQAPCPCPVTCTVQTSVYLVCIVIYD